MKGSRLWLAIAGGFVAGLAFGYLVAVLYLFADGRLDPTSAQVASSVAVAFFTGVLVVVTTVYALTTARQADAAVTANVLAQTRAVPVLMVAKDYVVEDSPTQAGGLEVTVGLVNIGGGIASNVEVVTDWKTFAFKATIPTGLGPRASILLAEGGPFVGVQRTPGVTLNPPVPTEFRFDDQHGKRYRQKVGGLPEPMET